MTLHWSASSRTVTNLLTDRRLRSCLSGAVLTTWSLTRSKQWRWSRTSGEIPLLSPHSPSWIVLWLQWSHSDSWAPQFLRTWSGTITLSPLLKRPSRGCTSFIIESVLCTSITVWFSSTTKSDLRRLRRVVRTLRESLVQPSLLSKNCTYPEWAKGLAKSLWTPHIQHTPSLNCYRLVDATELWAPERPDTGTVSSLRQSISWTLDIKRGTHNTIYIIYSPHILIFSFQFCTYQTCTHIYVYIIYCVFAILYIAYLYIILLLSVSCPVAVILLHCGASVTITNSSYV